MKLILASLIAAAAVMGIASSASARPHTPPGCWWSHRHLVCPHHHSHHPIIPVHPAHPHH